MSTSTGPALELNEKLLTILNLQADAALKEAQLRRQSTSLYADTALRQAQLDHLRANLQADTALMKRQADWEPWKAIAMAMAAGGALVGAVITAIVVFLHVSGKG